jgi:hypothetical protein
MAGMPCLQRFTRITTPIWRSRRMSSAWVGSLSSSGSRDEGGTGLDLFRLWAAACSHIHTDLKQGRRSIAGPIAQSEFGGAEGGPSFDWDILLHLGDISGTEAPPTDADGPPVVEQLVSAKKHRIVQIYHLLGNHGSLLKQEPHRKQVGSNVRQRGRAHPASRPELAPLVSDEPATDL